MIIPAPALRDSTRQPKRSTLVPHRSSAISHSDFEKQSKTPCSCGGSCQSCQVSMVNTVESSHTYEPNKRSTSPLSTASELIHVEVNSGSGGTSPTSTTTPATVDVFVGDPGALTQFFCLWKASNYGVSEFERAAWVLQSGTSITLNWWPATGAFNKETFKGVIPSSTIAFVHTHPNSKGEQPSTGDRDQSQRLGLPLYVITGGSIWRTDGSTDSLVAPDNWWKPYKKTKC